MEVAVGTINLPSATTGNRSVTGKTPAAGSWQAVLFWWSGRAETIDASGEQTLQYGIGAATAATARWAITGQDSYTSNPTALRKYLTASGCIATLLFDVLDGLVDFVQFNADGFTVNITDAFNANMEIGYMLIGNITSAKAGTETCIASLGDGDYTTAGFQPDFVLITGASGAYDTSLTSSALSLGAATASNQGVLSVYMTDNVATTSTVANCFSGPANNTAYEVHNYALPGVDANVARISFTQFVATGFRLNRLEGTGANPMLYLALKGGSYSIGDFLTATDTNAFTEAHGLGVTPKGILFFSANRAASTQNNSTTPMEWSVGASDGTNRICHYARSKDGNTGSDTFNAVEHDEVYINADNSATMVIEGLGDCNSVDGTNLNLQMDDADPVQSFVWYVAFGDTPGAPGGTASHTIRYRLA